MKAILLIFVLLCSLAPAALDSVEDLQREKVVVLKEVVDLVTAAFKAGEAKFTEVCKARMEYLEATLVLAKTHQERLRIHQEVVKAAEEMVGAYEKMATTHEVGRPDVLRAKAMLLDRKIALAREEQSGK